MSDMVEHNIPTMSDRDFERYAVQEGYLSYETLDQCKEIQNEEGQYHQKPLAEIALANHWLEHAEVNAIWERVQNKPLIFGGYEVKHVVGEGGLGMVYLAYQVSMRRDVAIKVLYSKWMKDEEFRKRFLIEARIAGKFSHPNLIQIFDICYDTHTHRYFFSMEYISGKTVEQLIQDKPLSLNRAIDITMQVLDALQYIWQKRLVHRDIKPSNIIMNRHNIAKLGDFGFVKTQLDSKISKEDSVLGTPDYMSPEQVQGDKKLDFRSDIYSLGGTLYHMLTGNPPFDGTESTIIKKHLQSPIPSPKTFVPHLPDGICQIMEKMMAKLPQDRYQTYRELKRDLELVKQGHSPKADRLDISQTAIARLEDIFGSQTGELKRLQEEIKALQTREYVYQILLIFLSSILLFLFIFMHK